MQSLPTHRLFADARALVKDPEAAAAAGPQARHLAWLVLVSERGGTCAQRRLNAAARLFHPQLSADEPA